MNRLIFTFFLVFTTLMVDAQNNQIAIIKYEQAEEAFNKTDFKSAISYLNECELLLGTTNAKIMFLKINAQVNQIEQDPFADYEIIKNVRLNIQKYLKEYENIPNNQEKYKEIYFTIDKVNKYPKTAEEFSKIKADLNEKNRGRLDLEQKRLTSIAYIQTWSEKYKFKTGLTKAEFSAYNEAASKIMRGLYIDQYNKKNYTNYNMRGWPSSAHSVRLKDEKVVGYTSVFWWSKIANESKKSYDLILEQLTSNVDSKYLEFTHDKDKGAYSCKVRIPGSQISADINYFELNNWYYTLVSFNDQNSDK